MNIFLTADWHLRHTNILKHTHRPFASIQEHDEALISNHNAIVKPNDIVVLLGDFIWKNKKVVPQYLSRLNGTIRLILGNHDREKDYLPHRNWNFDILGHYYELKTNNLLIVMCHYPFETWNKSAYNSIHFHGHSHGRLPKKINRLDVGVDNHNYKPISLEDAIAKAQKRV